MGRKLGSILKAHGPTSMDEPGTRQAAEPCKPKYDIEKIVSAFMIGGIVVKT